MAQQRHLASATYLVAFALICIPPVDALMQLVPYRIHDPRWRFGAFGLLSNAMMIPVIGLLIAFVAAAMFEHRALQRVLGALSLLVAIAVAGALVLFGLDTLQVRQQVPPAAGLAFKVASTTALAKSSLGILTLGAFALASFKAPRGIRRAKAPKAKAGGLIIGAAAASGTPRVSGGQDQPIDPDLAR